MGDQFGSKENYRLPKPEQKIHRQPVRRNQNRDPVPGKGRQQEDLRQERQRPHQGPGAEIGGAKAPAQSDSCGTPVCLRHFTGMHGGNSRGKRVELAPQFPVGDVRHLGHPLAHPADLCGGDDVHGKTNGPSADENSSFGGGDYPGLLRQLHIFRYSAGRGPGLFPGIGAVVSFRHGVRGFRAFRGALGLSFCEYFWRNRLQNRHFAGAVRGHYDSHRHHPDSAFPHHGQARQSRGG